MPLSRVTITGVSCAVTGTPFLSVMVAVYVIVPFSLTDGVAVSFTVVASLTSVTVVFTGVLIGLIASRLPPAASLMDSVTVVGPW
ncbi:hypothetical protein D3C75_1183220 [compost metagenome]